LGSGGNGKNKENESHAEPCRSLSTKPRIKYGVPGILLPPDGWTVVAGGNSGGRPRIGDVIAKKLSDEQVLELISKCLDYYAKNAKSRERMPRFIERVGAEEFRKAVL
jgi:NAD(P)H-nitrite reductase large subunit